jgi:hypothetical protein
MKMKYFGCGLMLSALVACSQLPNTKKNDTKANNSRQPTKAIAGEVQPTLTSSVYQQHQAEQGLVLMTINWGTKWRCADFDKATLQSIRFERLYEAAKPLAFHRPANADQRPEYVRYAFLVEPGEYALSGTELMVSKMGQKDDYLRTSKSQLIVDNRSLGGTFTAQAGEPVYIGNFWIDCKYSPIVWRLYTEGENSFNQHLQLFKQDYPFIDLSNVQYRLFQTTQFGLDYQLP